jgi:hypothetical protein
VKQVSWSLTDESCNGGYAAQIEVNTTPENQGDITTASLISDEPIMLKAGHTYIFSACIKRSHGQWFRMAVFGAGYSITHLEDFDGRDMGSQPTDWERYFVYFTAPSGMGQEAPYYLRIDNMVRNNRTADGPCRLLVDDIEVIDIGVEELVNTYTPGSEGYGIRNSCFNFDTEYQSVQIGDNLYESEDMPQGWYISSATEKTSNDAPGYPIWGQTVPAFENADGYAAYITAKAYDESAPSYPAISTDLRINPEFQGERQVLTLKYGTAGTMNPNTRVFLVDSNFNHAACLIVNPEVGIATDRFWSLSLHLSPGFNETDLKVRIDNITKSRNGFHCEESTFFVDDLVVNSIIK